jgi:hypothetical protein
VVPHVSQTYVNIMLPESHHFLCSFPRKVLSNMSRPLYSLSLDFHGSAISRVQLSLDSKSIKFLHSHCTPT